LPVAVQFKKLGFDIVATVGTSTFLTSKGVENRMVNKVSLGRPHVVDAVKNGEIQLVINTGTGNDARRDGYQIRRAALKFQVPYTTTIAGALAICRGITALKEKELSVKTLQEYHSDTVN
jgi:carbamoyl-phosphate synthase large subunit